MHAALQHFCVDRYSDPVESSCEMCRWSEWTLVLIVLT